MLAAGPDHLVVCINSTIGVFGKSGAARLLLEQDTFFPQGPGNTGVFDCKVVYDSDSQRFLLLAISSDAGLLKSHVHLAVSMSPDPTAGWRAYGPFENQRDGEWVDYPGLGLSGRAVGWSGNDISLGWPAPAVNDFNTLWIVDKAVLVAGGSLAGWSFSDLTGLNGFSAGTLMPSLNDGVPAGVGGFRCALRSVDSVTPFSVSICGITLPASFPTAAPTLDPQVSHLTNVGLAANAPQGGPRSCGATPSVLPPSTSLAAAAGSGRFPTTRAARGRWRPRWSSTRTRHFRAASILCRNRTTTGGPPISSAKPAAGGTTPASPSAS